MQTTKNISPFADLFTNSTDNKTEINTSSHISSNSIGCIDGEEIEHTNEHHRQSEIGLLKAIILQAIIDRMNNSKRTEDKVAKVDASKWFDMQNHDFKLICNLAGWSPEWVIEATEKAIQSPEKWRRNHGRYN